MSAVPETGLRVVGYYHAPAIERGYSIDSIDGSRLTHLNYAFGNVTPEGLAILGDPCLDVGDCGAADANPHRQPGGHFARLAALKTRFPHLRTLISIGGWGWSANFSDAAATPEARARFIESALDVFIRAHPGVFDGIDLDWEYPVRGGLAGNRTRPEDWDNYIQLLAGFREALDAQEQRDGREYLLTIAAPAGPWHLENVDVRALASHLDFANVMTYDYHTAGKIAHFNAPLAAAPGDPTPNLNVRATVDAYLAAGMPREKLVVGVPFFGYGYGGVPPERDGLFQPAERNGFEGADASAAPWLGAIRFRRIPDAMRQGFERHWSDAAGVPWLYDRGSRMWITYDDAESIARKVAFVRERELGGIMIWELSGDDGTLLDVIHRGLR